jgi:hypothetical protein
MQKCMKHNAKCEICENADICEMRKHTECEYMQGTQICEMRKCECM